MQSCVSVGPSYVRFPPLRGPKGSDVGKPLNTMQLLSGSTLVTMSEVSNTHDVL